jgi:hypothetical protein
MNYCLFCGQQTTRPKFCSTKCIKREWYRVRHPNSYFNKSKKFWQTETGLAFKWEKYAAELLNAKHLEFSKNNGDLDWNKKIVDVKVSNLYFRKKKRGVPVKSKQMGYWVFNRNKEKQVDFFLCICLLNNEPHKILLIPSNNFPKIGCVVGWKSKYDVFNINNLTNHIK